MGEAANSETTYPPKKQSKIKKHKLPEEGDQEKKDIEHQQPAKKLRKPQAPTQKSRKKLKRAERQQKEKEQAHDKYKSSVATYLESWKNDKSSWKFSKNIQNWILSNLYDSQLLPDTLWPIVLEYFEGSKGIVKTNLTEAATKIIESDNDTNEIKLFRAKDIIQSIVE